MSNSIISNLSHRNVDMNEPDGEKHLECISNEDHVSNEDAAVLKTNQKSPVVHQPFNEDNGTITEQPVNMDNQKQQSLQDIPESVAIRQPLIAPPMNSDYSKRGNTEMECCAILCGHMICELLVDFCGRDHNNCDCGDCNCECGDCNCDFVCAICFGD